MGNDTRSPVAPPLSPLAEVVSMFEEDEPEACSLLYPLQDGLTEGELEVRARRMHTHWTSGHRAERVSRALEIAALAPDHAARTEQKSERAGSATSPEEKERRIHLLAEALKRNLYLTADEGLALLNAEPGVMIAKGTFYGGYWRRAIALLPAPTRQLREEMTARRPGNGKMDLSDKQRAEVRELVAEIVQDHPDWHAGQIMDEVRRIKLLPFQDPVAFRRNYVVRVEAAVPGEADNQPHSVLTPGLVAVPSVISETAPSTSAIGEPSGDVRPFPVQARTPGATSALRSVLSLADPLAPAELSQADGGHLQIRLNLRPTGNAMAYRIMSLLYSEMAAVAEGAE